MLENLVKLEGVEILTRQQLPSILGGNYPGCTDFSGVAHCAEFQ